MPDCARVQTARSFEAAVARARRAVQVVVLVTILLPLAAPLAAAQDGPVEVKVGLLAINFGNYDPNKGTYLMDFYVWFVWDTTTAPEGFSPEKFEFMNGRAAAKDRIFDETDNETGEREVWYRVQANLYSDPRFADYPYDSQSLEVVMEDAVNPREDLVYVPIPTDEGTGLDESFHVAGWRVEDAVVTTEPKEYRFGETYDRYRFTVTVSREPVSTSLKAFLPPAAFVVVAGLAFFFHPSKVAQRLTLGTSMLISAVLFHISQTLNLPPLAQLILFDKIMLSVYSFLAVGLAVTTLISIDEDYWKDKDYTKQINAWGATAALVVPFVVYALLFVL